jgi:hypothetical protein
MISYHPATVCSVQFEVKMSYLQNEHGALPKIKFCFRYVTELYIVVRIQKVKAYIQNLKTGNFITLRKRYLG